MKTAQAFYIVTIAVLRKYGIRRRGRQKASQGGFVATCPVVKGECFDIACFLPCCRKLVLSCLLGSDSFSGTLHDVHDRIRGDDAWRL